MVTTIGASRVCSIQLYSGCREDADTGLLLSTENSQKIQEPPGVIQLKGSLAANCIAAFELRLQTRFRSVN